MPEPIEFRILENLRDALKTISVAGGYFYTVAATAVKLDPNGSVESLIEPNGPRPFILIEVRPESWEYFAAGEVRLVMPWRIHWVGESTPTEDDSREKTFFRGCADVEKAIAVDPGRGGFAIDTRITKREIDGDGLTVWAMVDIAIAQRRTYGTPSV